MVKVQTLIEHYRQFYNYKEDHLLEEELAKQLSGKFGEFEIEAHAVHRDVGRE